MDIELEERIRIVGMYASESKTWDWTDLSSIISNKCILIGDFNVDLKEDGIEAEMLINWVDSYELIPYVPDSFMSLRARLSHYRALSFRA